MPTWHPILLTLHPTRDGSGHEGALTVRLPGRSLILEVRGWRKVSGHIDAEVRLEIGDEAGEMDPGFRALVDGLVGRVGG